MMIPINLLRAMFFGGPMLVSVTLSMLFYFSPFSRGTNIKITRTCTIFSQQCNIIFEQRISLYVLLF